MYVSVGPYYAGEVESKIGLMYAHDYALSLSNTGKSVYNNSSSTEYEKYENSWIFLWGINDSSALNEVYEFTMSRNNSASAWTIVKDGRLGAGGLNYADSIRPVFYLTSDVKLSGNGSKTEPYIINN